MPAFKPEQILIVYVKLIKFSFTNPIILITTFILWHGYITYQAAFLKGRLCLQHLET